MSLNDSNTETRSGTSQPAVKTVHPFLPDRDVEEARQRAMESMTESKASDEGSSPPVIEDQPPRPPGPQAPPPPVDGGVVCWLQVLGAFGIWMNVSCAICKLLMNDADVCVCKQSWGLVNAVYNPTPPSHGPSRPLGSICMWKTTLANTTTVWRVPNVLRDRSTPGHNTIRDQLDRQYTSLLALIPWCTVWTSFRCWIL